MTIKCSVNKNDFLQGLSDLQNITNKKNTTLAILSNVMLTSTEGGLVLTGTDLEVGLKLKIPAQIHEEGTITLPSKKLFEIVRESGSDTVNLTETDNSWTVIEAGMSRYNLAGMPSTDFPEFPLYDEDNLIRMESFIFLELIDKVIFSIASEQENVYSLTSVLFEKREKGRQKLSQNDFFRWSQAFNHGKRCSL